jgi:predicted enzyme related to lactoylglutathione lyase
MFKDSKVFSGYSVNNIAAAKEFYQDVLDLEVKDTPMGLKITFSGSYWIFIYLKEDHIPATFTVLNFSVDDINKAVAELNAKDIKFELYEGMNQDEKGIVRGLSSNRGPDIAWFKDPAGNILSVLQQK